jgi:hypothetical protein
MTEFFRWPPIASAFVVSFEIIEGEGGQVADVERSHLLDLFKEYFMNVLCCVLDLVLKFRTGACEALSIPESALCQSWQPTFALTR